MTHNCTDWEGILALCLCHQIWESFWLMFLTRLECLRRKKPKIRSNVLDQQLSKKHAAIWIQNSATLLKEICPKFTKRPFDNLLAIYVLNFVRTLSGNSLTNSWQCLFKKCPSFVPIFGDKLLTSSPTDRYLIYFNWSHICHFLHGSTICHFCTSVSFVKSCQ